MVESKIKELWNSDQTIYFFDVDGVLAPLELGEYNHYYYDDESWNKALLTHDYYAEMRPNRQIQDFLKNKDKRKVYVITKGMNEVEFEQKARFCNKNYGILKENVFLVSSNEEKLNIMKKIKENFPELEDKYFVMIDDTVEVLNDIMNHSSF